MSGELLRKTITFAVVTIFLGVTLVPVISGNVALKEEGTLSKEDFEEKRFEYHKEIQEDFFASYRVDQVEIYTVKNGDNIWTLCHEVFEVPLWLLTKYNPSLGNGKLIKYQKINAPIVLETQNLL